MGRRQFNPGAVLNFNLGESAMRAFGILFCGLLLANVPASDAADTPRDTSRGDRMIAAYFADQTSDVTKQCLSDIKTREDWEKARSVYKQQLLEMLGLDPLPERTPLQPVVTGTVDHEEFVVENIHFQSRPGLYVTGNLYLPKKQTEPLPAILYVCGHGGVKQDGVSLGNKTHYQHHGAWFARNGYVCLTIDTLQLGEIEGIHHGTYRYGRWWWNSRGYTPAGVEAWNCIRSLDYLQTRPEVDPERLGVTGRSGGGAYSWWIAAADERIKAAVPVAGITSLHNHVVDGVVEGHCDCMFMVNTYRWDYAQVAAMVAPRPLLVTNTDKDPIFPLDGVVDVYGKARRIYELHGQGGHIGLQISEGGHKDIQELQIAAFHWFNRFLKKQDPQITTIAEPKFEKAQLRVFKELPSDELNTKIDESFTQLARLPSPEQIDLSAQATAAYRGILREKSFRGWPQESPALTKKARKLGLADSTVRRLFEATHAKVQLTAFAFEPQPHIELTLYVLKPADLTSPQAIRLEVLDEAGWTRFLQGIRSGFADNFTTEVEAPADDALWNKLVRPLESPAQVLAFVCPRGIGPTAWNQSERKQTQHRRRFNLLGQTLEGMQVWDVRSAIRSLLEMDSLQRASLELAAEGPLAGVCVYAALFEAEQVRKLTLRNPPVSHREAVELLNILRVTDLPEAMARLLPSTQIAVQLPADSTADWNWLKLVASRDEKLRSQLQMTSGR